MKVLVACEYSGVVRRAFRALGHDAFSCDLLEAEDKSPYHLQCDVRTILCDGWELMIAHPPCTYLAVSGARWFNERPREIADALDFVRELASAPIRRIAIENPVSLISSQIRKPDQIIQPWQFGHGETKATCLWLKNLPLLVPTDVVAGRDNRVHRMSPGPNRWKERSRTYEGIAAAMAAQWSKEMSEEIKITEDRGAPVKTRRPRQARKVKRSAQPITRGQGIAWGALGLTLGNAITLAVSKWLGVH